MKNRYAPKVLALVAASSVIMLAGCTSSADAPSGDPKSLMTGTKEAPLEWDATTADGETFETLNAVSQAATVVIQGTAESSRVERVSEVPFTVTTVNVSSVVSGTHEGASIDIRQFGDEYNTDHSYANVLSPGGRLPAIS